jgi:oxygen-dependent protoporphyrinogen oxidase
LAEPLASRVIIIGAGLTGLVAAQRLARRGVPPLVLEAKDRIGGAIWTERRDGFTLEGGADSFITSKPSGLDLCRELGLDSELVGTDTQNRRSFVVRQGRLLPIPEGFVLMAPNRLAPVLFSPILSLRGKLRMLLDLVLPRRNDEGDESLASFVRRRLGREALERIVQPLVGGIYTADPAELSLKATLPQFLEMERRHGGLIRGAWHQARASRQSRRESGARYGLFVTLTGGMGTLPAALAATLPAGSVRTGAPVRRIIRPETGGPWRVEPLNGPPVDADVVLVATEAHAAARLIDGHDPALAQTLRAIPYASSAIANVAYRRDQVAHPLDGFGAVVPAIENRSILAISFTSVKFPMRAPAGTVLMRVFLGGATQPDRYDLDDAAILQVVRDELRELIGAAGEPLLFEVSRHPRGMPQYTLGHLDRVAAIRTQLAAHRGLTLAGNYLEGVGVPDCIKAGQDAAEAILARIRSGDSSAAA